MVLAGGTLAVAGCGPTNGSGPTNAMPCGNANPDPCICGRPDSDLAAKQQCEQEQACQADGGQWSAFTLTSADGAVIQAPHCEPKDTTLPADASADGNGDTADDSGGQ